jgi:hypothetical protein
MQVGAVKRMLTGAATWHWQPRLSHRLCAIAGYVCAITICALLLLTLAPLLGAAAMTGTSLFGAVEAGAKVDSAAASMPGVVGNSPGGLFGNSSAIPVVPVDNDRSRMRCVGRAHDSKSRVCLFNNIYYDGVSKRWLYFGSQIELDRLEPNTSLPFIITTGG